MKTKFSWKTSGLGAIGVIATLVTQYYYDMPNVVRHASFVAATATALGLFFARDNSRTSEELGLTEKKNDENAPKT